MELLKQRSIVLGQVLAIALLVGVVYELETVPLAARRQILAQILVVTAAIYLIFTALEKSWRRKGVELGYIALNLGIVVLGLVISPFFLAAGLIAHGFWDLAHLVRFGGIGTRHVPLWYIFACLTYDWLLGVAIVLVIPLG